MQRIAVIGSGIAGLGVAWLLREAADITLYEASARPGGHAHTVAVGDTGVDTGFIVLNDRNYPLLQALLAELDVATQPSDMSFGVSIGDGAIEWAGDSLAKLFAQKQRVVDVAHWRMIADIVRFNGQCKRLLANGTPPDTTLGAFVDRHRYSRAFTARYLLPMAAAIWSTPTADMRAFPLAPFLRFLDNHGLLQVGDRPQWRTVAGGSRRYVDAIARRLGRRLRLNTPVARVTRGAHGAALETDRGETARYDAVVFACHADQALPILADADADERALLSTFKFQPNRAVLHTDSALMPRCRSVWSSWNYCADRAVVDGQRVAVTYWMNRLQRLGGDTDYFVSLNPLVEPDPARTICELAYDHPVFDAGAITAQQKLDTIQGRRGAWYCGAWCGYGFHEDGLAAATRVAGRLGARAPRAA